MWANVVLVCSRQAGGIRISQVNLTEVAFYSMRLTKTFSTEQPVYYSQGFFLCESMSRRGHMGVLVDDHFSVLGAPCARRTCQGWNRCESRECIQWSTRCLRELPHNPDGSSVIAASPVKTGLSVTGNLGLPHSDKTYRTWPQFLGFEIP